VNADAGAMGSRAAEVVGRCCGLPGRHLTCLPLLLLLLLLVRLRDAAVSDSESVVRVIRAGMLLQMWKQVDADDSAGLCLLYSGVECVSGHQQQHSTCLKPSSSRTGA
jgi:hypothetical protein